MCEYCRKLTQWSHRFKRGYDVNVDTEGETFIDFFNNLITHLETPYGTYEASIHIKYCPWCGEELKS